MDAINAFMSCDDTNLATNIGNEMFLSKEVELGIGPQSLLGWGPDNNGFQFSFAMDHYKMCRLGETAVRHCHGGGNYRRIHLCCPLQPFPGQ